MQRDPLVRGTELFGNVHQAALAAGVACMCLGKDNLNTWNAGYGVDRVWGCICMFKGSVMNTERPRLGCLV